MADKGALPLKNNFYFFGASLMNKEFACHDTISRMAPSGNYFGQKGLDPATLLSAQEVVTRPKILNRTILSN